MTLNSSTVPGGNAGPTRRDRAPMPSRLAKGHRFEPRQTSCALAPLGTVGRKRLNLMPRLVVLVRTVRAGTGGVIRGGPSVVNAATCDGIVWPPFAAISWNW